MSPSAMASGSLAYYLNLAREDYYLNGGEPPGIWWGQGAKALGLSGQVERKDLHALFRGFLADGRELVQNAGAKDRQPGWDLTFSAPKSVSTLWSQGDEALRREIQAGHFEAVKAALAYLEEELKLTRRGERGTERELARLIVATFEHGTSRDLDPNLHTHALVMNACLREDGTPGTILSKPFYELCHLLGALYRTELAAQLEARLGVRCCLAEGAFAFSIEGVTERLNKFFSKRRDAILEKLHSWGCESAAAAASATIATRKTKREIPPRSALFAAWKEVGLAFGFVLEQVLGHKRRNQDDPQEFKKALDKALERITSSKSHFKATDLMEAVAIEGQARCLSAGFVREQVRGALEHSKEIRPLGEWDGKARYTTRAVLAAEKELIQAADRLKDYHAHGVSDKFVSAAILNAEKPLTDEQKEAVRHLTKRESGLRSLEGWAGTGKTSTLALAREALEKGGYRVIGATVSAKAARELHEGAGINSLTLRALQYRMNPPVDYQVEHHLRQIGRAILQKPTFKLEPFKFDKKTALVLDEAAMISTQELAKLVSAVEKGGGMVITVFDRKQLQAIGPGGGAAFLADRHGKANLTSIVRQKNPMDVEIVKAFASGKATEAIQSLEQRGMLHVAKDRDAAMARLVSDWTDASYGKRERALIFAGTRAEVAEVNKRCQAARSRAGELGKDKFSQGDLTLYKGDRVLFTKNSRELGVDNGTLGTVLALQPRQKIATVKLDSGEIVQIPLKTYKDLQLGYAVTVHKGQGTTVDDAYLLVGGRMQDRELTYVQASRAKLATRLYTDQHEAGKNLTGLAKQMSKSHEKTLAHEVLARQEREREALRIKLMLKI